VIALFAAGCSTTQPTYSVMSARHAAKVDANEAARRLAQARLQREQGVLPLAGELARGPTRAR
jgi:hypothetical protein